MRTRPTTPTLRTIPRSNAPLALALLLVLVLVLVLVSATGCRGQRVDADTPEVPRIPALAELRAVDGPAGGAPGTRRERAAIDAGAAVARSEVSEEVRTFLRYCERELLVRAPRGAAAAPGGPANAWFGELVRAKDAPEGAAVSGLATVMFLSFVLEDPDTARVLSSDAVHIADPEDEWLVPRYAVLENRVGDGPFREALRELVDRHRGGPPIGVAEVAEVFEETAGEGAYVHAWLSGPGRPSVRTQWRYDEARDRVLVRIDQVHEVEDGRPAAFPFTMPLRLVFEDGHFVETSVEVENRRDLLSVDSPAVPTSLTFDPNYVLEGLVDFVEAPGD